MAEPHPPDPADVEPPGFLVEVEPGLRLHFIDWTRHTAQPAGRAATTARSGGGPAADPSPTGASTAAPDSRPAGVLLVHGLGRTAWSWAAVARRLGERRRVVSPDLRGHGLSDSPLGGYGLERLAADVVAVAEGSGLLRAGEPDRVLLAGHGFGAMVAAEAAAALGGRCAGLVLVDGGLEDVGRTSGVDADEFERGLAEPPEVLASMEAFLADRKAFDPASWDRDQERAARSTVVEVPAGHLVPVIRLPAFGASIASLLAYDPAVTLQAVTAPIVALLAAGSGVDAALVDRAGVIVRRFPDAGHDLPRYRPEDVTGAILGLSTP